MTRTPCTLFRVAGLAVLLTGLLTSCSGDGRAPSPPAPAPRTVTVIDLVLAGPASVPPGGTAQFTLIEKLSDGTERDVTGQALWSSNSPSLSIGNGATTRGLATARSSMGEAGISARYTPQGQVATSRTRGVLVLPDGTFRVLSRVMEPGGFPVPNVSVTVTSGSAAGQRMLTGVDGRTSLYGIAGPARVSVSKENYTSGSQDILVTAPDQQVDFELSPSAPIEQVAGIYTFTIAASSRCSSTLPEEARSRTYTATVTSEGRALAVVLSGATFLASNSRFAGRLDPGRLFFDLGSYGYGFYYSYFPSGSYVIELLTANRLRIVGTLNGRVSGNTISGNLSGAIQVITAQGAAVASCFGGDHQFSFVRR